MRLRMIEGWSSSKTAPRRPRCGKWKRHGDMSDVTKPGRRRNDANVLSWVSFDLFERRFIGIWSETSWHLPKTCRMAWAGGRPKDIEMLQARRPGSFFFLRLSSIKSRVAGHPGAVWQMGEALRGRGGRTQLGRGEDCECLERAHEGLGDSNDSSDSTCGDRSARNQSEAAKSTVSLRTVFVLIENRPVNILDVSGYGHKSPDQSDGHYLTIRQIVLRSQEQVHFPSSYEYLTIPPAPSDAGAFSFATVAPTPAPAASGDLNEAVLGKLADDMQLAMEQHGIQSPEFGEAQVGGFFGSIFCVFLFLVCFLFDMTVGISLGILARYPLLNACFGLRQAHFESTLEQWQRAVEQAAGKVFRLDHVVCSVILAAPWGCDNPIPLWFKTQFSVFFTVVLYNILFLCLRCQFISMKKPTSNIYFLFYFDSQWSNLIPWPDGDPERFAQLFDVVSRYAERQQNIKAGRAAPAASAPLGPAPTAPASPSTGSRVSWDEEWQAVSFVVDFGIKMQVEVGDFWSCQDLPPNIFHQNHWWLVGFQHGAAQISGFEEADSKHKKHRRRHSREKLPEVVTPSFGEWHTDAGEEGMGEQQGQLQQFVF